MQQIGTYATRFVAKEGMVQPEKQKGYVFFIKDNRSGFHIVYDEFDVARRRHVGGSLMSWFELMGKKIASRSQSHDASYIK